MENIDDLMRQKFDSDNPGERFEFQEEYWEQAQALLQQEEDRRRRRWWLFFALALGIALLAWLLLGQGFGAWLTQNEGGKGGDLSVKTEKQAGRDPFQLSQEDKKMSGFLQHEAQNQAAEENENTQRSAENAKISESSNRSEVSNPVLNASGFPQKDKQTRKGAAGKKPQRGEGNGSSHQLPETSNSTPQNDKMDTETPNSGGIPTPATSPITTPSTNQSPITSQPITSQPVNQSPVIPQYSNPTAVREVVPIFNLPIPPGFLTLPSRAVVLRKVPVAAKEPIAENIKPVENQRFSLGLSVAGSANQSDTLGRWAGWAVGAFGEYRLNPNWSLRLGAQWRFLPGYAAATDSSNPDEVEQLRYSFGFERESWKRETRGLHYLEIPIAAHWKKGRWGLEAGAATGTLLAVQNHTERTVSSSLEATKTEVKKFVKGDAAPYNRQYFSAFAGADYRLTNRISLMARGQYRFTPMFKNTSDGVKNGGLANLDLGLRFRLF